jgi:hypothetical protein
MTVLYALPLLAGAFPLWRAWRANRRTSLAHAVGWAGLAWAAWVAVPLLAATGAVLDVGRYVALCLTAAVAVAVLGAQRPRVGAWNFVVLGLLAVMLLPLAERLFAGNSSLDPIRVVFLCATLAVGVLNYLPTRLGPAALLVAGGCAWEVTVLLAPETPAGPGWLLLAGGPWVGWIGWAWRAPAGSTFDAVWRDFRDRFGLVWAQRLREQFNRAAANAGWPVYLSWGGLRGPSDEAAALATLTAMLRRFL